MKTRLNRFLTLFLAFVVQIIFAQEKTISGVVSDESGPLPGVSVLKKGTTKGTETDFDGNYSIKANEGETLVFSFIGMETIEKKIGSSNKIDIKMFVSKSNTLKEVVVVGYGTSTKKAYTGSIKTVKAEVLEAKSVANVTQALTGEVAGVTVLNTSGQPGKSAKIRIRGFGSVNGNRDPLYVVDGVPFLGNISSINPSDIASTSVLKDATATAIYGSRGANGVILITTKSGKKGKSSIEIDVKTGINMSLLPRTSTIKSPKEYLEMSWEAIKNSGDVNKKITDPIKYANESLFSKNFGIKPKYNPWNETGTNLIDPTTGKLKSTITKRYTPENWQDYTFQNSIRTEANVKFIGGSKKTKYFSSFGYLDDIGYVINSSYKRYATRLNLEHKPKDWLTAKVNIGYTYGRSISNGQSADSGNVFWLVDNMPAIYPLFLRDKDGNFIKDDKYGGNQYDFGIGRGFAGLTNAVAKANFDLERSKKHSINGNFSFKFDLTKNLDFQIRYGLTLGSKVYDVIGNPFYGDAQPNGGALFKENETLLSQNWLQMLNYKLTFNEVHNLKFLIAHESNEYLSQINNSSVNTVVNLQNGLDDPSNYVNSGGRPEGYKYEENMESAFGQVNYNYDGKYFVSGAIRRDGTSRYYNDKWGTFGSFGLGWIVSEEDFLENSKTVNYLKFKASYGIVGDQSGSGGKYEEYYRGRGGYDIDVTSNGEPSLKLAKISNPDLTWETSTMFQTGLEFTLFNNFIDGSFDYYKKNTDGLVFNRRMPPSTGNALITVNDGELLNQGVEFDLSAHLINKENFKLNFGINGEFLDNEMKKMPIDPNTNKAKILDQQGHYGRAANHSIFDYYLREWAGVDPNDGLGMWYMNYHDKNNNGKMDVNEESISNLTEYKKNNPNNKIGETTTKTYSNSTQRFVGKSAIPTIRGAFRINASYKNISLSSQFSYSLGGYSYDDVYANLMENSQIGSSNWHTDMRNSWKKPGDITNVPRHFSNFHTDNSSTSTRFLRSTDYLAFNNFRLGYTFPKEYINKTGLSDLNIWLSGDNLMLLSDREGFNPSTSETGGSSGEGRESGSYRYSPVSTFSLGLRVKF